MDVKRDQGYFRVSETGIEFLTLLDCVNRNGKLRFIKLVKGVNYKVDIHVDLLNEEHGFYVCDGLITMTTIFERNTDIRIGGIRYFTCILNTLPNCKDFLYKDKVKDLYSRLKGRILNNVEMKTLGVESVNW